MAHHHIYLLYGADVDKTLDIQSLQQKAVQFRRDILETLERAGSGHPGGSLR